MIDIKTFRGDEVYNIPVENCLWDNTNYDGNIFEWRYSAVQKPDVVNHPSHYTSGGIEAIDVIKAKLTPEEFKGFLKGTLLKYSMRAGKKDDELQDFEKGEWYLKRLIQELKS